MISLIHPSRGRPEKSFNTAKNWVDRSGIETELILIIDTTDEKLPRYQEVYSSWSALNVSDITICISSGNDVVNATNTGSKNSRGDILVYLSDDFICFDGWGSCVAKEFETNKETLIKVDDCLQKFNAPVLTIPIMNRALYERLGYFWHPEYKSMFVDEDLYWTAQKLGALRLAPHLKFPHEHHSIGKAQNDETYKRSEANWNQGKEVFARRRMAGFPV